jgi:hypothetical protein
VECVQRFFTLIPNPSFQPLIKYGVNSSRNPDPVPAKAGNHYFRNTGFPRIKYPVSSTGQAKAGLVKPGMTNRIILKAASNNVIPAKAGIQKLLKSLDSRLRGSDKLIIIRSSFMSSCIVD